MDADAALKQALWGHFQSESFAPNDSRVMTKRLSEQGFRSILRRIAAILRDVPDIRAALPSDHTPAMEFVLAARSAVQHRYPLIDVTPAVQPSQLLAICLSESFHARCWSEMAQGKSMSSTNWTSFCSAVANQLAEAVRSQTTTTSRGNHHSGDAGQPADWRLHPQERHTDDLEGLRGGGKSTTPNKASRSQARKHPSTTEGPRSSPVGSTSKLLSNLSHHPQQSLEDKKNDSVIELALSPLQPAGDADEASPRITGVVRVVPKAVVQPGVDPSTAPQNSASTGTPSLVTRGPAAAGHAHSIVDGKRTAAVVRSQPVQGTAPVGREVVQLTFGSTVAATERSHGAPVFMPAPTFTQPTPSSPPRRSRQRADFCDPCGTPPSHHVTTNGATSLSRRPLRAIDTGGSAVRGASAGTCRELLIGGWSPPAPAVSGWCHSHNATAASSAASRSMASGESLGVRWPWASPTYHARYDWAANQELRRHQQQSVWPGQRQTDVEVDDVAFDDCRSPFGLMLIGEDTGPCNVSEYLVASPPTMNSAEACRQHRLHDLGRQPFQSSWHCGPRAFENVCSRATTTTVEPNPDLVSLQRLAPGACTSGSTSGESPVSTATGRPQHHRWSDIGPNDTSGVFVGAEATNPSALVVHPYSTTRPGMVDVAAAPMCAQRLAEPAHPPSQGTPAAMHKAPAHLDRGAQASLPTAVPGVCRDSAKARLAANGAPNGAAVGPSRTTIEESTQPSLTAGARARCSESIAILSSSGQPARVPLQTIPLQQLFPATADAAAAPTPPPPLAASTNENAAVAKAAPKTTPMAATPRSPASTPSAMEAAAGNKPLKLPTTRPKTKSQ